MVGGKGRTYVDDEDDNNYLDDYYEDYDSEGYGAEECLPVAPSVNPKKAPPKGSSNGLKAGTGRVGSKIVPSTAAAAGASALARHLCDPAPSWPSGKPQKGGSKAAAARVQNAAPFSLVTTAPDVPCFAFDTLSPDDTVLRAQGRAGGRLPPPSATPAAHMPARTPPSAVKPRQAEALPGAKPAVQFPQRETPCGAPSGGKAGGLHGPGPPAGPSSAGREDNGVDLATEGVQGLHVGDSAPPAPTASPQRGTGKGKQVGSGQPERGPSRAKPKVHMVVVGHVDAGKSTLMGRLLHDVGEVSAKAVHKQQRDAAQAGKASFSWAWLLDERPEERARGVTVDLAYARFQTPSRSVTLLDAPGHRDFVPNMIAGAAQADCAILVVDGSPGGFEAGFAGGGASPGGQTREHAQLVRSLGVAQIAVAITKLDTCGYSQERYEAIKATLAPFLRQSGFRDSAIQWLPVVALTGQNLVAPPTDPALASWWKGPTLLQAIDGFEPPPRETSRPLRLPVSDVVGPGKGGVLVAGKVEAGILQVGAKVLVVPSAQQGVVRSITVDGNPASEAQAGDSAEVAIQGIDPAGLAAGIVVCAPSAPVPLATRLQARVLLLDVPTPVLKGQPVTVHAHAARESGHISALGPLLDPRTGEVAKPRPRVLTKGQTAIIELTLAQSLPVELYSDLRALGRIALREKGRTLAVGIVTAILE